MKLATSKQIQEIDRKSIEDYNIPSLTLMENAGSLTAEYIIKNSSEEKSFLVLVGKGNNGGDGLVIARKLLEASLKVTIVLFSTPDELSSDAKKNWERLKTCDFNHFILDDEKNLSDLSNIIKKTDYIIDAIFGTGLSSDVRGIYKSVIKEVNRSGRDVFSVDISSGLSADNGIIHGVAVKATHTVTFGLPKVGHFTGNGSEYSGRVKVVDIGFPSEVIESFSSDFELSEPSLFKELFTKREKKSHKGTYGKLLVIAGSAGKIGSGWLTSRAALRSGVGLVTYALPREAYKKFDLKNAEVMVEPVEDEGKGYFVNNSLKEIINRAEEMDALSIGPGIGKSGETSEFIYNLLKETSLPVVLDADGLNVIADRLDVLKERNSTTILTPHPGEFSRLTGKTIKDILKNRLDIARDFSKRYGIYLILKGNNTLIATPDGKLYINPTGNPGMATAGMGDALTGILGAFLTRGWNPELSCVAAVYIHGLAGDIASEKFGETGIITSDMIESIPAAINIIKGYM